MANYCGLLLLMVIACAAAMSIKNMDKKTRIKSDYLVTVKPKLISKHHLKKEVDSIEKTIKKISKRINVTARYDFIKMSVLHVRAANESLMHKIANVKGVNSIEANLKEKALTYAGPTCVQLSTETETGDGMWGLARIATRDRTSDKVYRYQDHDSRGSYVYLVDTGVRLTHFEFEVGQAFSGFVAEDIKEEGSGDLNGHGTHCAASIIGKTYGVAKGATVVSVKVVDSGGYGSIDGTIAGLEWIKKDFNETFTRSGGTFAAVVSMSVSFTVSFAMDSVVEELFDLGLITVTSAGNAGSDACLQSPGGTPVAVTVMASDKNDRLASWSNRGECGVIIAPGERVLSAYNKDDYDTKVLDGTSMACPLVAGTLLRHMVQKLAVTGHRPSTPELYSWLVNNASKDKIQMSGAYMYQTFNRLLYSPCDVSVVEPQY